MVKSKQYKNGLRLIVDTIDNLFSVAICVNVMVGSCNETKENNGISHYIEHMLFKGTERRTAFQISEEMESIGADINAFTSKENTCFYVKSINEHTAQAMDVLSDIFFNATFSDEEAKKERKVILEEINMSHDTPDDYCADLAALAYYGNRDFGYEILGSRENVKRFTKAEVLEYMDRYYTADNVVISVCGNVSFEEAESLTEKYFANNFKDKKRSGSMLVRPLPVTDSLFAKKDIEQAHITLKFPSVPYDHPLTEAVVIADTVLGGGMSSRLFQKIREEMGLCYSVYSYVSQYYSHGVSDIYAGVNPASRDDAVSAIIEEIELIKAKGITQKEFSKAREQYKASIIFAEESTVKLMRVYGRYLLLTGKIYNAAEMIEKINALTLEEVNQALKTMYDTSKMAAATVGIENRALKF